MTEENTLKRLSILKLLYKIGVGQSYKGEMTSYFSVLSFHDSVEMFLKLVSEKKNKKDCHRFMDYWEKIPELTLKEAMRKLKDVRVNLKHKAITPSKLEIETSRVNTTLFFEENTPVFFNFNFSDISLFELIKYEKTKNHLKDADSLLKKHNYKDSIRESVKAFNELLLEYKLSKSSEYSFSNPFDLIEKISYSNSNRWSNDDTASIDKNLKETFKKVNENFSKIGDVLQVVSLGIDYKKYLKFSMLSPKFYKEITTGNYGFHGNEKEWSESECEFFIDFVLDSALVLQEFDFSFSELSNNIRTR